MKKTALSLGILGVLTSGFANDTEVNKQYVDIATKDGLINHYKTISQHRTDGRIELGKIEKIYDFKFPIYKIEYLKEYYKDGIKEYVVDVDYIEVDNNRFFASLRETLNYDRKDFEFYKINNFDKLISKCKDDEKCIQFNLGNFNKEDNLSYEKIKFMQ
ncbi:hypothetical protein ACN9KI_03655 [Aliarcobacter butzleri]|uniref:hypothetical protein n=1 Tax=Aliarcobacter butzleri TaxID=28197 RepID=UPI003B219717